MRAFLDKYGRWTFILLLSIGVHALIFVPSLSKKYRRPAKDFEISPPKLVKSQTALSVPMQARNTSPCFQAFSKLFKKDDLHIHIVFGYKDTRPARFVGDRYESGALIHYLTSRCPETFNVCEFQRDPDDAEHLFKSITGPDGNPRMVHVYVVHSAYGPDDDENVRAPLQRWKSAHAERVFIEAVKTGDIVFYNGHSRDGGGPDFSSPRLLAGHVNYPWYVKHQEGFKQLLTAIEEKKDHPKMLGLFSCRSTSLFHRQIQERSPQTALIGSENLLYYVDALKNVMGALSGILGMACENEMASLLQAETPSESKLVNFFR